MSTSGTWRRAFLGTVKLRALFFSFAGLFCPLLIAPNSAHAQDTKPPTVTITKDVPGRFSSPYGVPFTFGVTFTFSEAVTGFERSDISLNNGSASAPARVDDKTYTADITGQGPVSTITINVAAGAATDLAGNENLAAPQFEAKQKPVISNVRLNFHSPTNRTRYSFSFDASMSGVTSMSERCPITSGNNGLTVEAGTNTFDIFGLGEGTIDFCSVAMKLNDRKTKSNRVDIPTFITDFTRPTVLILGAPTIVKDKTPFPVTFQFSEPVIGFDNK